MRTHIEGMKHVGVALGLSVGCALSGSLFIGCGRSHEGPTPDAATPDSAVVDAALQDAIGERDAAVLPHWEPTRSAIACTDHTATSIAGGDVLLVGRCTLDGVPVAALRYGAASRTAVGLTLIEPRHAHGAVPLPDGGALVIGGFTDDLVEALGTTERFDPATDTFRRGPTLSERRGFAGVLVWGTRVVVAGGREDRDDGSSLLDSVEVINLADDSVSLLAPLARPREHALLRQRGEVILAVGGVDGAGSGNLEHLGSGATEALPVFCPRPTAPPDDLLVICDGVVLDLHTGVRVEATLRSAHMQPAAARLPDGALLVLGSSPWTHTPPALPERVAMGASSPLPDPEHGYLWPTATLLADGTGLVVGEEASELLVR